MPEMLRNKLRLSGLKLRLIAMLTMLIDHTAACGLLHGQAFTVCRIIGRLAFPIFAFLLAEGIRKTGNVRRFLLRLFLFALLSEVPFDLAFFRTSFTPEHQNIFWTLLLAVLGLAVMRRCHKSKNSCVRLLGLLALPAAAYAAKLLRTDYGMWGVILICAMYFWLEYHWNGSLLYPLGVMLLFWAVWSGIQHYALLAFPVIFFYNGQRGRKLPKLLFYGFYPVHLMILLFFCYFIVKTRALS